MADPQPPEPPSSSSGDEGTADDGAGTGLPWQGAPTDRQPVVSGSVDPVRLRGMLLAQRAGQVMLANGVSVADCERALRRLLDAAGLQTCEVVAELHRLTLCDVTLDPPRATTIVRRVAGSSLHLHRLVAIERLVRRLEADEVSTERAFALLEEIATSDGPWPGRLRWLAGAVAVAGWSTFLGGDALSAVAAAVAAIVVSPVVALIRRTPVPEVFAVLAAALVGILVPYAAAWAGVELRVPPAALGAVYPFLPGSAFVASVTDGLSGSPLSSLARAMEALLAGLGVALGVLIGLQIVDAIGIVPAETSGGPLPSAGLALAAFVAMAALAINRDLPRDAVLPTALLGVVVWVVADLVPPGNLGQDLVVALAAAILGFAGGVLARIQSSVSVVYTGVAVLVLVPGTTLYLAMVAYVRGTGDLGGQLTGEALAVSLAIAGGTALGLALGQVPTPGPARLPTVRLPWRHRGVPPSDPG